MGEGPFRRRLRLFRLRRTTRDTSRRWVNDAPRAPPIPPTARFSDASSALTDATAATASSLDLPSTACSSFDRTCLICLDSVALSDRIVNLPTCHHAVWHSACIRKWLHLNPRCPLCAASVIKPPLLPSPSPPPLSSPPPNQSPLLSSSRFSIHHSIVSALYDDDADLSNRGDPAYPTNVRAIFATSASASAVLSPNTRTSMPSVNAIAFSTSRPRSPVSRELPWTLSERRVHERCIPPVANHRPPSQGSPWWLPDRRLSAVSQPSRPRRRRCRHLPRTFTIIRRR